MHTNLIIQLLFIITHLQQKKKFKKLNTIKEFNSNLKLNNQIFDFKNLQQISDQINLINNSNLQLDSSKLKKKKEDILTIKKEIKKKKIKIDDITSAINEKKKK